MKHFVKIISVVLMLSLCFATLSAFAPASTVEDAYKNAGIDDFIESNILEDKVNSEENLIGKLKEAESDLYTFVYKNDDGTNTMEVFEHPVKYIAEDGATRDISLSLKEDVAGYVPTAHEIATVFPEKLGDGIALAKDDVSVTLIPKDFKNTAKAIVSDDKKAVVYPLDEKTSYKYSLTYTGFKEDIVVEEYNGRTEYEFTLMTGGLTLKEEDGSYTLVNDSGEVKAIIGDIIVFTADERNNCLGTMTYETVRKNQEYRLTIHLEDEYLRDEKTMYPIRIDPTIEINYTNNGSGAIIDVTVNSSGASYGTSSSLYVGKRATYGKSRVLMRFPNLNLSNIACADNIINAYVNLRDLLCESEAMTVNCHKFSLSGFTEAGGSWDTLFPDAYSSLITSKVVSYANGQAKDHVYAFLITNAVKDWKLSGNSSHNAILFKADDSVETGSTYIHKTFGSYNGTSLYRPSLKITYATGLDTSVYYSEFDDSVYNDLPNVPTITTIANPTHYAQYRMNCYGYALGFILEGKATVWQDIYGAYHGYKQKPGEFASSDDKKNVASLYVDSQTVLMKNIISNMKLDARRWGYIVYEYIPPASGDVKQFGTNSRLIAVVTVVPDNDPENADFHFYRQESDKSWSHKPGSYIVSNKALSNEPGKVFTQTTLTNSNIKALANSGAYKDGSLKFLVVTKSAAVDFTHTASCCALPCNQTGNGHSESAIYKRDTAGDYKLSAKTMPNTIVNGKLDYVYDHDFFRRATSSNTTYSEVMLSSSNSSLILYIYNSSGTRIKTIAANQRGVSLQMTGQQTYYFEVFSEENEIANYILILS